jgi:glycosyltransferase involved in cell wall biosynthesis
MNLKALALMPYPTGRVPAQRYRIEQWARTFAAEGIDITFLPFLSSRGMDVLYRRGNVLAKASEMLRACARRVRDLPCLSRYDVGIVCREAALLGPPVFEALAARRMPLIFDFDDALYLPPANSAHPWLAPFRGASKTAALCRMAFHVTAGNQTLAGYAREQGAQTTVLPSTIDTTEYVPRPRPTNVRPIVGWTGSHTTLPYLLAVAAALVRLRQRCDFEFRVIGATASIPGLDLRCQPWRAETEADDVAAFDIGLMPLPDNPWTRAKCGLKALQYMALGIPPVVSPVGVNAEIVTHGVDGLHATTDDSWIESISRLLSEPDQRARLGAEARLTVERRYSARVNAPRIAAILRAAAMRS